LPFAIEPLEAVEQGADLEAELGGVERLPFADPLAERDRPFDLRRRLRGFLDFGGERRRRLGPFRRRLLEGAPQRLVPGRRSAARFDQGSGQAAGLQREAADF
jgi:hypothetical protein